MSCTSGNFDCFLNCDPIVSDQCVQYTGADVPAFGISQGDQLSSTMQIILTELQSAMVATGIVPENVTLDNCPWLKDQLLDDFPNLSQLLQLIIDNECTLKDMVDVIDSQLQDQSLNFNTLCLTGLPVNPSPNDILQAAINTLCAVKTTVDAIPATYVKNSDLNTQVTNIIQSYLANSQTGQISYYQYLPLKAALPYFGPLTNFDNTGKGLASAGMDRIYLANGLNGTPDLRGMTLVGAVRNVPGAAFNPLVDPTNPDNPNWAIGDTYGENKHLLTTTEIPAHTHTYTDPGHTHSLSTIFLDNKGGQGGLVLSTVNHNFGSYAGLTKVGTVGITIDSTGGSQKHNNVQPSTPTYWIIRML